MSIIYQKIGQTSNDGKHVILNFNNVVRSTDTSATITDQTPNDGEHVIMKALIDGGTNGDIAGTEDYKC